ncbi:putative glycoprotein 1 [Beihai hermit crab virus 4]|uniref:Putative glycoprotein 1 n=1 Tax=Beihai hermit crab virus 4 TaxID=1922391 RepID=A0A1L3KIP8_9NIDO|nr:putative glycoprotein 1 [Beihai hermit crab virus 4]APG77308.1 putative glycoprotein 1 [Beihai hermit crab virus 4]
MIKTLFFIVLLHTCLAKPNYKVVSRRMTKYPDHRTASDGANVPNYREVGIPPQELTFLVGKDYNHDTIEHLVYTLQNHSYAIYDELPKMAEWLPVCFARYQSSNAYDTYFSGSYVCSEVDEYSMSVRTLNGNFINRISGGIAHGIRPDMIQNVHPQLCRFRPRTHVATGLPEIGCYDIGVDDTLKFIGSTADQQICDLEFVYRDPYTYETVYTTRCLGPGKIINSVGNTTDVHIPYVTQYKPIDDEIPNFIMRLSDSAHHGMEGQFINDHDTSKPYGFVAGIYGDEHSERFCYKRGLEVIKSTNRVRVCAWLIGKVLNENNKLIKFFDCKRVSGKPYLKDCKAPPFHFASVLSGIGSMSLEGISVKHKGNPYIYAFPEEWMSDWLAENLRTATMMRRKSTDKLLETGPWKATLSFFVTIWVFWLIILAILMGLALIEYIITISTHKGIDKVQALAGTVFVSALQSTGYFMYDYKPMFALKSAEIDKQSKRMAERFKDRRMGLAFLSLLMPIYIITIFVLGLTSLVRTSRKQQKVRTK